VLGEPPDQEDRPADEDRPETEGGAGGEGEEGVAAEDVVAHQVGPGGGGAEEALALPVDAVGVDGDPFEGLDDRVVDLLLEDLEGRFRPAVELGRGVPAVELDEIDLVARGLHLGEVLAPGAVDRQEGDPPFDPAQQRFPVRGAEPLPARAALGQEARVALLQHLLAPLLQGAALGVEQPRGDEEPLP